MFNGGSAKPRLVPTPGHHRMAEIANGYDVLQRICASLGAWDYVVSVQNAETRALRVATHLTLPAVPNLDLFRQAPPRTRVVIDLTHGIHSQFVVGTQVPRNGRYLISTLEIKM
jgi:hypothetical protein